MIAKAKETSESEVSFSKLFIMVSKKDMLYLIIGISFAIVNGCLQPMFSFLQGEIAQSLSSINTPDQVESGALGLLGWHITFGIISFIISSIMMYFSVHFGESQAIKFRMEYYKQLISQDVSYFEFINSNELSTKISSDCFKIQQAIGEKMCLFVYSVSIVISSLVVSLIRAWQLALISCTIIPAATLIFNIVSKINQKSVIETTQVMQAAGGIAEQALSAIKTVKSLQGEEHESNRYSKLIKEALTKQFSFNFITGVSFGVQSMVYFLNYSLPFWVGSIFIEKQVFNHTMQRSYDTSDIIVVFTSMILAGMKLSTAMNSYKIFIEAKTACSDILKTLNKIPSIEQSGKGIEIQNEKVKGEITFENVEFSYPTRKQDILFKNITFTIQPYKKTAIVGKSGCGKSTLLQLIEHFYQPSKGRILLDGVDTKDLSLESLRRSIGYVSQEPVLFAATIRDNLRYAKPDATEEEMISALRQANIWQFIEDLNNKLDTFVGNSGTQLSGGQKQRICIARAILRNPAILLLDEATSALDCKSEAQVQATLDSVSVGRTTVIVAHSLNTIKNADEIIVIDSGEVVERGSHDQLIQKKGIYNQLHENQNSLTHQKLIVTSDGNCSSSSSNSSPTEIISHQLAEIRKQKLKIETTQSTKVSLSTMNDISHQHMLNVPSQSIATLNNLDTKIQSTFNDISYNNSPFMPIVTSTLTQKQSRMLRIQEMSKIIAEKSQFKIEISKIAGETQKVNGETQKMINETNKIMSINNQENTLQSKEIPTKQSPSQEQQEKEQEQQKSPFIYIFKHLFRYDRKAFIKLSLGLFFSISNGIAYPLCGWILGKIVALLLNPNDSQLREKSDLYSLFLTLIGVFDFIFIILQYYYSSKAAQQISFSLRTDMFSKFLKMPISWYDKKENNSSSLALSISQNCESIHTLIGQTLAFNFQAFVTLLASLLLSFSGDWRTSLVGVFLVPWFLISYIIYAIKISHLTIQSQKASLNTVNLINESACNIKTITSFGNKDLLVENFSQILNGNISEIKKYALNAGLSLGFANFTLFFVFGVIFYLGALFHLKYDVSIENILISIECLTVSATGLGKCAFFMGDARSSALMSKNIFKVLESKDETQMNKGKIEKKEVEGEIEFRNVSFSYPEREQLILKNISFKIPAKSRVAFVGASGAGKSSIIQLLQRFYTNYTGEILFDGIELQNYDLSSYRSKFGAVQQEPVLFSDSIQENIRYNQKNIDFEQIKNAAKMSNALQFIEELGQDGFDKKVGLKGNQLSGGQKQRISLSQVIVRQPQVILFDEVTSALDSHNEQIVQSSIQKAFNNHTTVSVAHRLNTIIDSDIIFVIDNGVIVEQGTYQELLNLQSHFYSLMIATNQQISSQSQQLNEQSIHSV